MERCIRLVWKLIKSLHIFKREMRNTIENNRISAQNQPNAAPLIHERSEVNEQMARDEARHGKALQGLLERYFR